MKIRINFLFGIIALILCLCDAKAATPCPEGCFCLKDGQVHSRIQESLCGGMASDAKTMHCDGKKYGITHIIPRRDCANYKADDPDLIFAEDFSEIYYGDFGWYGFKNGQFLHGYSAAGVYANNEVVDALVCPETHPYSAKGSKALTDCFNYDERGNKIYYGSKNIGTCNIEGVGTLVKNLQSALDRANKAAQDLQDALNKAGQKSKADKSTAKTVINSSLSDKVKKLDTGKSIRSSSVKLANGETAIDDEVVEETESTDSDIELAKKLISLGIEANAVIAKPKATETTKETETKDVVNPYVDIVTVNPLQKRSSTSQSSSRSRRN